MIRFILGTFFGGIVGVFAMCLCQAAGQADALCIAEADCKRRGKTDQSNRIYTSCRKGLGG